MPTTTKPRQLTRDAFIRRCRELIDEGLGYDELIEKLNPVRSMSVTEQFMRDAIESISEALGIADSVSNPKMTQAHRDFVNRERYATEYDGVAASTAAGINRMYPDAPIRAEKLKVLRAEQQRRRAQADEAAADWTAIQLSRATFDSAVQAYPQAFTDAERKPWESKPVK